MGRDFVLGTQAKYVLFSSWVQSARLPTIRSARVRFANRITFSAGESRVSDVESRRPTGILKASVGRELSPCLTCGNYLEYEAMIAVLVQEYSYRAILCQHWRRWSSHDQVNSSWSRILVVPACVDSKLPSVKSGKID